MRRRVGGGRGARVRARPAASVQRAQELGEVGGRGDAAAAGPVCKERAGRSRSGSQAASPAQSEETAGRIYFFPPAQICAAGEPCRHSI